MPSFKSEQFRAWFGLPARRLASLLFAIGVGVAHPGLSGHALGAEVTTKVETSFATIGVVGNIDERTPGQIAAALGKISAERKSDVPVTLILDSRGGDLEAAIAAGILVRTHALFTSVPEHAICASACTFAFLGGVQRTVLGRYGIHRPYLNRYIESPAEAQRSYERVNKVAADYLRRMNVSARFLEAMNFVSPGDVKWLTTAERRDFGIEGNDPVWEDRNASAYAQRLGISRQELYERQQQANRKCSPPASGLSSDESSRCTAEIVDRGE